MFIEIIWLTILLVKYRYNSKYAYHIGGPAAPFHFFSDCFVDFICRAKLTMFVLPIIIAKNCQWDKFRNWLDFIAKATVDFFVMLITFFFYVWHLLRLWNPMSHRIWNFRQIWFMILSWIDSSGHSKFYCSFSHLISLPWGYWDAIWTISKY